MGPGDTALTRIPRGASSTANVRAKDRSAALVAPAAASIGIPLTLEIAVVRTTAPPRLINGASFWTAKNDPFAFTLNTSSYMASVVCSKGAKSPTPALTKRRSNVSNSAFARVARASISVNDPASLETTSAPSPSSFCAEFKAGLRATRHQNARAPVDEHLRRREPYAARAADDDDLLTLVPIQCDFLRHSGRFTDWAVWYGIGGYRPSDLRQPAVDRKLGAGRVSRVERKEEGGLRNFLRRPDTLQQDSFR